MLADYADSSGNVLFDTLIIQLSGVYRRYTDAACIRQPHLWRIRCRHRNDQYYLEDRWFVLLVIVYRILYNCPFIQLWT